jgi:prephenate dehydratase
MALIYSDIPELEGTNTEIVLSNLVPLEEDLKRTVEKRLAHLSELSRSIVNDGGDEDVIESIILSIKSDGYPDRENDFAEDNLEDICAVFSKISVLERLIIFKNLFGAIGNGKKNLFPSPFTQNSSSLSSVAEGRIAYLQNTYTDEAYMYLSSVLKSSKASYYGSMADVCESVRNNQCEFCILPIETKRDGKLLSFYESIISYKLKIIAEHDITEPGKANYTRYALLGKNDGLQGLYSKGKAHKRFFEFIVHDFDNVSVSEILLAADFCSLKLQRIDTLELSEFSDGSTLPVSFVFRIDEADMMTFLSFLKIDCPDYISLGIYTQIQ